MIYVILAAIIALFAAGEVVHHVDHSDDGMYGICHDVQ